jgi:hypothetical protein
MQALVSRLSPLSSAWREIPYSPNPLVYSCLLAAFLLDLTMKLCLSFLFPGYLNSCMRAKSNTNADDPLVIGSEGVVFCSLPKLVIS